MSSSHRLRTCSTIACSANSVNFAGLISDRSFPDSLCLAREYWSAYFPTRQLMNVRSGVPHHPGEIGWDSAGMACAVRVRSGGPACPTHGWRRIKVSPGSEELPC